MKQRKLLTKLVAVLLVCVTVFGLVGCDSTLSGTYTCKESLLDQRLTFEEDKVTGTILGININGTYEIKEEKIVITYSVGPLSYDTEYDFKESGDSIFIDGVEYKKEN